MKCQLTSLLLKNVEIVSLNYKGEIFKKYVYGIAKCFRYKFISKDERKDLAIQWA